MANSWRPELTVRLRSDQPGEASRVAEALGAADVNIDGFAEVEGLVHVLVEDSAAAAARRALAAAGLEMAHEHAGSVVPAPLASEVLAGKRSLTADQVRGLASSFRLPTDAFLRETAAA